MDIKGFFTKIVKYIVTTLLGTITDTVVLWCLAHYVFGDSHFEQYIVSPCISFECAVFVNYLTAYFYVWKDRINRRKSGVFFGHFWKYNLSCISAFILKMLILNGVAVAFKWDPVICNLVALCFSGILNFSMNEFVIFRKKEGKEPKEQNLQ